MIHKTLVTALVICLGPSLAARAATPASPPDAILKDIKTIVAPGVPGTVLAFGPDAFVIAAGTSGKNLAAPVIAATTAGKGRVVIFGHDGYFGADNLVIADTPAFMKNLTAWAAAGRDKPRVAVVGVRKLAAALKGLGLDAQDVDPRRIAAELPNYAIAFFASSVPANDEDVKTIRAYIDNGGAAMFAITTWAWMRPGRSLASDLPANRLLIPLGLAFSDGTVHVDKSAGGLRVNEPVPAVLSFQGAVDRATANPRPAKGELAQAEQTLMQACRILPPDSPPLRRLRELCAGRSARPSPEKPVKSDDVLSRVAVALELREFAELPIDRLRAHPAAPAFPGDVPAGAPRVARKVEINTAVPRWHSTGLYAAPGEVITLTLPADAASLGLSARLGVHTDRTWHHAAWRRVPEISKRVALAAGANRIGNPFGGMIYIEVPDNKPAQTVTVSIANAVEAPLFVRGKTTAQEWLAIRKRPAPWAELGSDKLIITVPSEVIRDLDDPSSLVEHWDKVLDACATLAGWPIARKSPERMTADADISAGYMHSGYPIMTHLDVKRSFVDLQKLKGTDGAWGFYHELGHNHQSGDWTFDGTGEVTVNLFTMYVLETVCGASREQATQRALGNAKRLAQYLARPDFATWKEDPFLALAMYAQLRMEFGWEPFIKVIAEYRTLPANQRPRDDQAKRDQWMVRFSNAIGRNLGPFFEAWGVPTTPAARKSIEHLPGWMPAK